MNLIKNLFLVAALFAANTLSAQQVSKAELKVTGLTCSMCSQATEKSLQTLDFIGSITPDLNKNVFVVDFKKGKNVDFDLLKKKVEDAGFSVGALSATFVFSNAKVDANGRVANTPYKILNAKSRTLNGPVKVEVVDKGFISSTAFKQRAKTTTTESYASGTDLVNGKKMRIYHLSI